MLDTLRRRAPYLGYVAASTVARRLPAPVASLTARAAADVAALALRERREMVERHLRRTGRPGAAREVFRSYGKYWLESFRLADTSRADLERGMQAEGIEHLEKAKAAGNGVIMALPHLG
ncbi:MAG TPA: hypothetical protein VGB03_00545, partial [Acidimicrobiales bacterium]